MYELLYFKKTMSKDEFLKMCKECMDYYEHTSPEKYLVYKQFYIEILNAPVIDDRSIFYKGRDINE